TGGKEAGICDSSFPSPLTSSLSPQANAELRAEPTNLQLRVDDSRSVAGPVLYHRPGSVVAGLRARRDPQRLRPQRVNSPDSKPLLPAPPTRSEAPPRTRTAGSPSAHPSRALPRADRSPEFSSPDQPPTIPPSV